jgi:hypothetical protein
MAYWHAVVKAAQVFHVPRRIKKAPPKRGCSLDSDNLPHVVVTNDDIVTKVIGILLVDVWSEWSYEEVEVLFPSFFYFRLVLVVSPVSWDYF